MPSRISDAGLDCKGIIISTAIGVIVGVIAGIGGPIAQSALNLAEKYPTTSKVCVVSILLFAIYKKMQQLNINSSSSSSIRKPSVISSLSSESLTRFEDVDELASQRLMPPPEMPRETTTSRSHESDSKAEALTDPVTFEPIRDPVLVKCCGKTFEKSSIERCLVTYSRCPLCNANIQREDLIPNRTLKDLIDSSVSRS